MATELPTHTNGATLNGDSNGSVNSQAVKEGLARMLKGGVIMDVVNAEQVFWLPLSFHLISHLTSILPLIVLEAFMLAYNLCYLLVDSPKLSNVLRKRVGTPC
jgi:hypothetical protein